MRTTGLEFPMLGKCGFKDIGEPPAPGPNQVLIETVYSGMTNGTERHAMMAEHTWSHFPSAHGYQHVGKIAAIGDAVEDFEVGDWVFYGQYVGHRGWNLVDIAPRIMARDYMSHLVVKIPDGLDRALCALLGVSGVAMRAARRLRIRAGDKVWVSGQGLIGGFTAQAALACGAHVTVSDLNRDRLDCATSWGASRVLEAQDRDMLQSRLQETAPYDCLIDASGHESFLKDIQDWRLPAFGARIGLLAVRTQMEVWWPFLQHFEASLEVSCHFSIDDLRVLLNLLENERMDIGCMTSHRESIDDAPALYEILRDTPSDLMGVVFDWSQ